LQNKQGQKWLCCLYRRKKEVERKGEVGEKKEKAGGRPREKSRLPLSSVAAQGKKDRRLPVQTSAGVDWPTGQKL